MFLYYFLYISVLNLIKSMKKILILFNFLLVTTIVLSQEIPPINVFSTEDYGAENQNWSITQGDDKYIYVANNEGLLEFNGASWNLYPTPNETIMRSVYFFNTKVYSGSYMDFGFWTKDNYGSLNYTSIVEVNKIEMLEDEQIWEIEELDGWVLFKSLQRIYLYNIEKNILKIINAENDIIKLTKIENTVYYQEFGKGIFVIENGAPKLISNDKIVKDNRVIEIFIKDNKLLALTEKEGFYFISNTSVQKWDIATNDFLSTKTIYSAKELSNGEYVLGTISNGLVYLKSNGDLNYQITQSLGLSNNTVLSIFEDIDYNLWLGLDNGINTVNLTSPFKQNAKQSNFWGTIYTSIVFNNILYLGTNQGLYYRVLNSNADFKLITKTEGQVWNLQNIDGNLFCSHNLGTFIIKKDVAEIIQLKIGVWGLAKIDDNKLLQGAYDGLYILSKEGNKWGILNKIDGFSNSSRYFLHLKGENSIFVNHEYKGVFKLKIDENYTKVLDLVKDNSVEKGIHSSLIQYQNKILYSCKKGIYEYDKKSDSFKIDTTYRALMPEEKFLSAKLIHDKKSNKLWSFTQDDIRFLIPGKLSNKPSISVIPVKGAIHKGASGYENIINIKDKEYLIGTSNGYLTIDLNKISPPKDFSIRINKVFNHKLDDNQIKVDLSETPIFHYKKNNIEFHYSVPNYTKTSSIEYQYILEGFNEKWSTKSDKNSFLFENLPSGDYTFKVRSFIDNESSINTASFYFEIDKPWFLSTAFKFIYGLAFISLLLVLHFTSRRYYKKQREKLLDRKQREFELKELENSKNIIKLNNEKLRADIESKNRELATSTMSIIKKNDFLGTIKNELVSGGKDSVSKVVKIIDKNLNNADDWKMFQEAFNNADKNFIKKVKTKHPELTPNDLRLCAYLRLNLSSKEIAPLLNISPRSVEVKRYRLRKKMKLEHDANLTDYIISI